MYRRAENGFPCMKSRVPRPLCCSAAVCTPAILLVAAFAGIACSIGGGGKAKADSGDSGKVLEVKAVPVQSRQINRNVESVGSLFPYEEVVVSSEVEGKCEKVLVDVGDWVNQGQVLVEISPVELRLTAEQQTAALEQARARLGLPESVEDLQDPAQAAGVKKAAADLKDAEQKYQRAKELSDQGLLPMQSYEEAESHYKSAQASYDLALQDARTLEASLKQYRASSALAQKKVQDASIRAPFSGYVKDRSVTIGQYVKVQSPVATILEEDPLRVRLAIPEKMAGWIAVGETFPFAVEAYPGRSFTGKISRIDPSVDSQTRTFQAEALVSNKDGVLKPGFFVHASVPSNRSENTLTAPNDALRYFYGVYSVYVVNAGHLKQKEVTIGDRVGDQVEVLSGLAPGDTVAVPLKVEQQLLEGEAVKVVP
jgi:membrane fusion protein, multidrug efflux system